MCHALSVKGKDYFIQSFYKICVIRGHVLLVRVATYADATNKKECNIFQRRDTAQYHDNIGLL